MASIKIKDLETLFQKKFRIYKRYLTTALAERGKRRLHALVNANGYAAEAELALQLANELGEPTLKRANWAEDIDNHTYRIEEMLGI